MRIFKYYDDLTGQMMDVIPLEDAMMLVEEAKSSDEPFEEMIASYVRE